MKQKPVTQLGQINKPSLMTVLAIGAAFVSSTGTAHAQLGGNDNPTPFTFSASRPRLVVLLHGVTAKPEEAPEIGIGTSKHARYYWGFDFIKGVQGRVDESEMRVVTPQSDGKLAFKSETIWDWRESIHNPGAKDLAPICFPVAWNTQLPPNITSNQTAMKEYVRLMTKDGANSTSVMVASRDGSKHLMPQLGSAIDQIYYSYITTFGNLEPQYQPQIYLVGHSFGGVIARGILSNPTGADLFGNTLNIAQRARADYIRNRVVLVHTLSAPHEGTMISDVAEDAADMVQTTLPGILTTALTAYSFLPWKNHSSYWVKHQVDETMKTVLDAVSGKRDCLEDLMRMDEYNNGILEPSTSRRSARGELVPIYTAAGRNPGGKFYDRSRSVFLLGDSAYNPVSNIDIARSGYRPAKEAMALTIIEALMRVKGYGRGIKRPWGLATLPDGD